MIIVGQVIPVFEYVITYIADKELSGTDVHHLISNINPESLAFTIRQLDSNVVAAVLGDDSQVPGLSGSAAGATSKASSVLLLLSSAQTNLTQLPLRSEAIAWQVSWQEELSSSHTNFNQQERLSPEMTCLLGNRSCLAISGRTPSGSNSSLPVQLIKSGRVQMKILQMV